MHGLTDALGRPRLHMLSSGKINDMTRAGNHIARVAEHYDRLIVGRGYDARAIRAAIAAQGAQIVIPSTASRRAPIPPTTKPTEYATSSSANGVVSRTAGALPHAKTNPIEPPLPEPHRRDSHLVDQLSLDSRARLRATGRCASNTQQDCYCPASTSAEL